MSELKPTVFVVDPDVTAARDLRVLLESVQLSVETHGGAGSLLQSFDPSRPGCLVLDVRMPEMSGIELWRKLRKAGGTLPVIFATAHGDVDTAVRAMREGAFDFLQKPVSEQYLLDRVHAALERDRCDRQRSAERQAAAARFARLSAKERQVVDRILCGRTSKAIAAELGIGIKTVDFHRANIMRKVGVETVGELVCLLFRGGYDGPSFDADIRGEGPASQEQPKRYQGAVDPAGTRSQSDECLPDGGPEDGATEAARLSPGFRQRTGRALRARAGTLAGRRTCSPRKAT